jgi:hypothetical protein
VATQEQGADARLERAKRVIRGLLERTEDRGCSESEAMEAAVKVGALLMQYDLDLTEVVARDTSDMVSRDVYGADYAMSGVITGISRLCSLRTYSKSGSAVGTYRLFGHAPDVELAVYLYAVCVEAADVGFTAHMQTLPRFSQKARDSFRIGFGQRVYQRMLDLRAQRDSAAMARAKASNCTSLVVLKDQIVEQEFQKTGVKLVQRKGPRVHDGRAYSAGHRHGDTVNLNNPLGYGSAKAGYLGG